MVLGLLRVVGSIQEDHSHLFLSCAGINRSFVKQAQIIDAGPDAPSLVDAAVAAAGHEHHPVHTTQGQIHYAKENLWDADNSVPKGTVTEDVETVAEPAPDGVVIVPGDEAKRAAEWSVVVFRTPAD
jgi:hypothetical protein